MKVLRNLPTPDEVKNEFPISEKVRQTKKEKDKILKDILAGRSDLFALIIGPCSADNEEALIDYRICLKDFIPFGKRMSLSSNKRA